MSEPVSNDARLVAVLRRALEKAQGHLEYCGYGDNYERELARAENLDNMLSTVLADTAAAAAAHDARVRREALMEAEAKAEVRVTALHDLETRARSETHHDEAGSYCSQRLAVLNVMDDIRALADSPPPPRGTVNERGIPSGIHRQMGGAAAPSPLVHDAAGLARPSASADPPVTWCSQCGNPVEARACGPTHALLAAELRASGTAAPSGPTPEPSGPAPTTGQDTAATVTAGGPTARTCVICGRGGGVLAFTVALRELGIAGSYAHEHCIRQRRLTAAAKAAVDVAVGHLSATIAAPTRADSPPTSECPHCHGSGVLLPGASNQRPLVEVACPQCEGTGEGASPPIPPSEPRVSPKELADMLRNADRFAREGRGLDCWYRAALDLRDARAALAARSGEEAVIATAREFVRTDDIAHAADLAGEPLGSGKRYAYQQARDKFIAAVRALDAADRKEPQT